MKLWYIVYFQSILSITKKKQSFLKNIFLLKNLFN